MHRKRKIDEVEKIATEADAFVKKHIRGSSTDLTSSDPEIADQNIEANRKILDRELKQLQLTRKSEFYYLYAFQRVVELFKPSGYANCSEQALLALHYITNQAPELKAEVFKIKGADHAFVVINRAPDSDPKNPKTWGEEAYVCDPWSSKQNVYPVKDHRDFLIIYDEAQHHELELLGKFDSENLRNSKEKILTVCLAAIQVYKAELGNLQIKLMQEHGVEHPRTKIVSEKIAKVNHEIAVIGSLNREKKLDEHMLKTIQNSFNAVLFTKNEWNVLVEGKHFQKLKQFVHRFFGVTAESAKVVDQAEKNLSERLNASQPIVRVKLRK